MKNTFLILIALATTLSTSNVLADESFAEKHPRRAEVNRREKIQQERIANGIESGKMSPEEAAKVEHQEASIKRQEAREVKANGGTLTKRQQRRLNREENRTSKEIYEDKH